MDHEDFEAAIVGAKAEGDLSRANVTRLATEKADKPKVARRRPITDSAFDAGWDLRKVVDRLERIAADDRYAEHKATLDPQLRFHLSHAVKVCQDLIKRME